MSKRTILKNAMSKKYCGSTYFDYLDKEELPLIYKAMEEYSKKQLLKFCDHLNNYKGFEDCRFDFMLVDFKQSV